METANIRPRGRPRSFSTEVTLRLVSLYNQGHTMEELAERFGVNPGTISRTLHKHNEKVNAPACDEQNGGDALAGAKEYRHVEFTSDGAA